MKKDGVGFPSIGTPKQNHIGFFNFLIGIGTTAHPKHCRQTDDAGSMSGSIATVDIVGTHDHPNELLGNEVHFIGGFRATKDSKSRVAMVFSVICKSGGNFMERLVPRSRSEGVVFTNQGSGKP